MQKIAVNEGKEEVKIEKKKEEKQKEEKKKEEKKTDEEKKNKPKLNQNTDDILDPDQEKLERAKRKSDYFHNNESSNKKYRPSVRDRYPNKTKKMGG